MALQYIIVLLLFGSASIQSESVLPNGCPADFHIHRLLPHETDCGQYYQCSNGQRILKHCAPGTLFSEEMQVCNWPHLVECYSTTPKPTTVELTTFEPTTVEQVTEESTTTKLKTEEHDKETTVKLTTIEEITEKYTTVEEDYLPNGCPKDFSIHLLLPHETECDKFYQCSNGIKYLMQCGAGTLFDNILQICNWPHLVECHYTTPKPTTAESTTVEQLTEESTTNKITTEGNDKETTVKLTTIEEITEKYTTVEEDFLPNGCPKEFSIHLLLPHETECDKFYECSNGIKYLMQCGAGTLYDNILQVCNWPYLVECHSTTPKPTTVELTTFEPTTVEQVTEESNTTKLTTEEHDKETTVKLTTIEEITEKYTTVEEDYLPNGCPKDFSIHLLLPHETECDKFYQCSNGIKYLMQCGAGTLFDNILQICNWPHLVECRYTTPKPTTAESTTVEQLTEESTTNKLTTEGNDKETTVKLTTIEEITEKYTTVEEDFLPNGCPKEFSIHLLLPHETECDKFYECRNGIKYLMQCGAGTLYDNILQVCNWPYLVECHSTTPKPTTVEPTTFEPTTVEQVTEESTTTKLTTEEHDKETTVKLTTIEEITEKYTTVEEDYLPNGCPKDFSIHLLLPHETECDKFYQCSNGIKYLMQCGAGTLFDNILQVCNWPYFVECPATTTKPTTVEPVTEESTTTKLTTEEHDKETTVKLTTIEEITEKYTTVEVPEQTTTGLTATTLEESTTTVDPSYNTIPDGTTYNPDNTTQDLTTTTPNSSPTNEDNITVTQSSIYTTLGYGTETQNSNYTTDDYTTVTHSYNNTTEEDVTETQSSDSTTEEYTTVTQSSNYTTEGYTTETSIVNYTTQGYATITESSNSTIEDYSTDGNIITQYPDNSTTQEFITITEIPNSTTDEAIITTEAPICPAGVFGNVPHPNRCDVYYLCSGGIAFEVACASGFEFDPVWKACVEIAEGGCTLGSVTDNENTNFTTTELPKSTENITDTSVTQDDSNTSVQDFTTKPGNTELDEIKEETTTADLLTDYPGIHESTTLKYEPNITTEAPICPAGVFGNVPHPHRCDAYYLCSGGISFEVACASGFEFDPVSKVCVEIVEGGCTLGSITDNESENNNVTTTEFPTNTETITDGCVTHDESYTSDQDLTTRPGNAAIDEIKEETTTAELLTDYPGIHESTTLKYTTDGHVDEVTKDSIDVTNTDGHSNSNTPEVTYTWIPGNVTNGTTQKSEHSTIEATTDEPHITTEKTTVTNEFTTAYNITEDDGSLTNNTITQSPDNTSTEGLTATTQGPNYNTTDESNTTTLEPICPVGVFGNVPHPDRCNAYFLCSGGVAFEIYCSEGFEFNADLRECVKISEGGCTLGKLTTLGPNNSVSVEAEKTTVSDTTTEANTNNSATEGPWDSGNATTPGNETTISADTEFLTTQESDTHNSTLNTDINESTTKEYELTTQSSINNVTLEEITTELAGTETVTLASTQQPNVTTNEPTDSSLETTEEDIVDVQEPICLPGVFGNVPHPERCDAFYICSGGFSFEVFCSDGFEFDRELQECVEISQGGCTLGPITTEENIIISSTTVTNINSETTIESYKEEETDEETELTDAPWNVPAPILPLPVPPAMNPGVNPEPPVYPEAVTDGDIDERTTVVDEYSTTDVTEPICPSGVFGNIPHQTRCDVYYLCSAGMAFEVLCPVGFEFDPNTKDCVEIAEGGCTLGTNTNNFLPKISPLYTRNSEIEHQKENRKETICKGNLENIPHEEMCSSFYKCVEGEMLQLFCNEGFEFEHRLKKCVPVTETGCTAYKT